MIKVYGLQNTVSISKEKKTLWEGMALMCALCQLLQLNDYGELLNMQ